jgi:hypothetical protein
MIRMDRIAGTPKHTDRPLARFQVAVIAVMALLACLIFYLNRQFFHDDAYITLRYARNLLGGNGIVWNPGEYVQGYTNFLFLVLIVLLGLLGVDLYWASRILGLFAFCALVLGLLYFQHGRSRFGSYHPLDMIPVLLVSTAAPLIVWSIGGLEGPLFSLLVSVAMLSFLLALRAPASTWLLITSGVLYSLAFLTRPDGAVFIAATLVCLPLLMREKRMQHLALFLLPCLGIILPFLVWQFWYYGDIVPNTFYAKAGVPSIYKITAGLEYLSEYALTPPFLLLLCFPALLYMLVRRRLDAQLGYLSVMIVSYLLFLLYAGGDHMTSYRLMLPLIPAVAYLLYRVLKVTVRPDRRLTVVLIYLVALFLAATQLLNRELNPLGESGGSRQGTIVGKYIRDHWPQGSLVALNTAGSTPYYAEDYRYIDMLGLNDRQIARRSVEELVLPWQREPGHAKGDGDYVLSRRPDYIILGPSRGTLVTEPWFLTDLELLHDSRFHENYQLNQVRLTDEGQPSIGSGLLFTYYQRISDGTRR